MPPGVLGMTSSPPPFPLCHFRRTGRTRAKEKISSSFSKKNQTAILTDGCVLHENVLLSAMCLPQRRAFRYVCMCSKREIWILVYTSSLPYVWSVMGVFFGGGCNNVDDDLAVGFYGKIERIRSS